MKLPGSRPDVLRTRSSSGPSPVGGSFGGTDSQKIMALDDFELQAVYYNMACAHSRLGNISEVCTVHGMHASYYYVILYTKRDTTNRNTHTHTHTHNEIMYNEF
jgi:hypothetical protein